MKLEEIRKIIRYIFKNKYEEETFDFFIPFDIDDEKKIVIVPPSYNSVVFNEFKTIKKINSTYIIENSNFISEDELKEYIPNYEDVINEFIMDNLVSEHYKKFDRYEEQYNDVKYEINQLKQKLRDKNTNKEHLMMLIAAKPNVDEIKNKIKREIELIKKHKNFADIEFKNNSFYITVTNIIIFEECSERYYYIGSAKIKLDFEENTVKFLYTEGSERRKGFWGDKQIHPHVDLHGDACLGNSDVMFAEYLTDREYYAAYLTAVNFLKSVNTNDVAGYAVSFWDECDENGNFMFEGHTPSNQEYGFSNDWWKEYIDSRYYCNICGEHFDYELQEINTPDGIIRICNDCYEDYVYCKDTERYVLSNNAYLINDEYYEKEPETEKCDDCCYTFHIGDLYTLNTPDGIIHVCEDCADHYTYCIDTEHSVYEDDAYFWNGDWYENDPEEGPEEIDF